MPERVDLCDLLETATSNESICELAVLDANVLQQGVQGGCTRLLQISEGYDVRGERYNMSQGLYPVNWGKLRSITALRIIYGSHY